MMYTESCFFFACALAFVLAGAESQLMIQEAVDSCAVEHGLPDKAYENFVLYDLNMKLDDCVAACAMKKLGTMSSDGVFTGEKAKELMDKAPISEAEHKQTNKVIDECARKFGTGGKDSCEIVRNLRTCYEIVLRDIMYDDWTIHENSLDLKRFGKWCMITGCTQGLGKSFLGSLAERKFSLVLVGPITESLNDLASDLELLYGIETKVIDLDITPGKSDYQELREKIDGLEIGVLINNFSVNYPHPEYFLEVKDSQDMFNEIIWGNVVLVTQLCRIVMPQMVERRKGVIINISSTFAVIPSPLLTVFAASKAFVLKFSKDLSVEYGKKGIIVQCLCPGSIASDDERWISPNSKVYVESARTTVGKDPTTTGFFAHTLVIGLIRTLWRLSPNTLIEWMTAIMERNRRRELKKLVN